MILNNFRDDIKEMVAERGQYQSDAAYAMGISRQLFDARVKWATVTKGYLELCEYLGYDMEIKYVISDQGGRVLNDFIEDFKDLVKRSGLTPSELARELGCNPSDLYQKARCANISKGYREILGYVGYDAEVKYIKR